MDFSPSFETVLSVAALAVFAAAIAGGVPAFQATGRWRRSGINALGGASMRLGGVWTALLAVQVALSLAVLPSAMEMAWGMFRPNILGPEFPAREFLSAQLVTANDASRFDSARADVVRRLQATPGVFDVSVSTAVPMEEPAVRIDVDGGPAGSESAAVNHIDAAFFELFHARFLAGRGFAGGEFQPGSTAVVVNRSFVEDVFGDGNPLGRRFRYSQVEDRVARSEAGPWREIVGVVDNFPSNNPSATMYFPLVSGPRRSVSLTVRVGPNAALVTGRLKEVADSLHPALRVGDLRTLDAVYFQRQSVANTVGVVFSMVMTIVLLFSMAGIYTLTTFTVARRWKEIGLRSALGARPRALVTGILGRALAPVAGGAIIGELVGLLLDANVDVSQAGGQEIPGIVPACAALLVFVAIAATVGPARRALRIEPAVALRTD